jgi:molybdopterin synthase sulfur carrier subunit
MKVHFFATLRAIAGQKTVEFDIPAGATVRVVVDEIVRVFPSMRRELLDEQGQLYGHVHVFINGRDTPYLDNKIDTVILPDDVISVFPAVGGGTP